MKKFIYVLASAGIFAAVGAPVFAQTIIDTTPPSVVSISILPMTDTGILINFTTNEIGNTRIEYGRTAAYGNSTLFNSSLSLKHPVVITGLTPNVRYHYRIITSDQLGNQTVTPDETFVVPVPSGLGNQVLVPRSMDGNTGTSRVGLSATISGLQVTELTSTTAVISWKTDVPSDSEVEYGKGTRLDISSGQSQTLVTSHMVTLKGLAPNSHYIFRIKSNAFGQGIAAVSGTHEFNTLGIVTPVIAPASIVGEPSASVVNNAVSVTWSTDRRTTSQVEYGVGVNYGLTTPLNSNLSTSHRHELPNLESGTIYHFRVKSVDEVGNITFSQDGSFTTLNSSSGGSVLSAATIPLTIGNLAASEIGNASVKLGWNVDNPSADVTQQYDVRFSLSPISADNFDRATPVQVTPIHLADLSPNWTGRSYVVAGLAPGGTYYFALKSKRQNSTWSGVSNVVKVMTTFESAGARGSFEPTVIKAESTDGQIIFTWNNPGQSNFVRTMIVRKSGSYPGAPFDGVTIYEGRGTAFADTKLQNNETYYYTFYSYNRDRVYSRGVNVSISPSSGVRQVKFNTVGALTSGSVMKNSLIPTVDLRLGSQGEAVKRLQQYLIYEGSYSGSLISGYYGSLTQEAVRKFQVKYGITPAGGYVGPQTREKMKQLVGL